MKNLIFDFISRYMTLTEQKKQAIIELDTFRTFKKGTILLREGQLSQ